MLKTLAFVFLLSVTHCALAAQAQPPVTSPDQPRTQELTPQVLAEMLRTATTFHELVSKMSKSIGPDQHVMGPDGQYHHPLQRTAAAVGAGAGAGAAVGSMTHSTNGVLVGAIIGSAGGLIVDQILRHLEEMRANAVRAPGGSPDSRQLQRRDQGYDPPREPTQ